MRFFKIFLICFSSLIGIMGTALGVMYLAGSFTKPVVQPEQIAFAQTTYEVCEDFEMTITTTTEDVTETRVTLSFDGSFTEENTTITNGIITVPKYVHIGTPFTVTLNKESKLLGEERLAWIKGGISTLKATSTNVNARVVQTKVYVDVPVYKITVETMTSLDAPAQLTFNINSSFWAKANFVPAESAYRYGKNGSDGNSAEFKTVFFSILSNALIETANKTQNAQQFQITKAAQAVEITAQVFSSIKTEIDAFALFEGDSQELVRSQMLALLDGLDGDQKAEASALRNFEELTVGQYNVDNSNVPSEFNKAVQLFASKPTTQAFTHNLALQILATDNQTSLQSEIKNVGIAIATQGANGLQPALESQFVVDGAGYTVATINAKEYKFYFPFINQTNINQSYWEITALAERVSAKLFVVLFNETSSGYQINPISLNNGNVKYSLNIDETQVVSNQVYWTNAPQTSTILYVYDNASPSQSLSQQYDLKTLPYVIPSENSYKSVVYFAYLEEQGGTISSSDNVENYINVGTRKANYVYGSNQTAELFEVPNGVITPKNTDFPQGFVIRVVFATVKTNYDGSYIFEDDKYVVDKFSSLSSLGTLQTLSFEIEKTLETIDAHLQYDSEIAVLSESDSTLAVVAGTKNAFSVVFDVSEQKSIFIRDYNNGKIGLVFKINNQVVENIFKYTFVSFDESAEIFSVLISVDYLSYQSNDPGYRYFTVGISYARGNESPIYIPITSAKIDVESGEQKNVDNPTLEVYDGKIASISFENDLKTITVQNPITVRTSLEKDTALNNEDIPYALQGSTNSFSVAGEELEEGEALYPFVDGTNKISIKAYDKYDREIEDETLWTLVSEDTTNKILTVDASGQSLNYLGTSTSPIRVYITTANGIGGRTINSPYSIYFNVETLGRIVYVSYNDTGIDGDDTIIYNNYNEDDNEYTLVNPNSMFSQSLIPVSIVGKQDKIIYLTNPNENNLLTLYYGLPVSGSQDKYDIFDLLNITKFVREDGTSFDRFVEFYTDAADNITSFKILKHFGQTGYLNLIAVTDIGISFSVRIEITPNIQSKIGEYGHQEAQGGVQQSISYVGVFANHTIQLQLEFSLAQGILVDRDDPTANFDLKFTPLLYHYDDGTRISKRIAMYGSSIHGSTITVEQSETQNENKVVVTITFKIDDVAGATYNHYIFVLDNRVNNIPNQLLYTKNQYDYSRDFYLRVNPNVQAAFNSALSEEDAQIVNSTAANLTVAQNEIIDVLTIDGFNSKALINVTRRVSTSDITPNLTLIDPNLNDGVNYVVAKITNEFATPVSSQYFELNATQDNDNVLRLRESFTNSQIIYISVFHYVSGNTYYVVGTFKITLTPDIVEKPEEADRFVVYGGVKYLQLEPNMTADSYDFEDLASYFAVSKEVDHYILIVSFEPSYVNQTTYWRIIGNTIEIKQTTVIISNRLVAKVTIDGVGTVDFPIIIMPRKAPLVMYDTTTNVEGDFTHRNRNIAANADLANLLSVPYLVENDIYDTVADGLSGFSIIAQANKDEEGEEEQNAPFGLFINAEETVLYSIRDGNGGFEGTDVASISPTGHLSTNFVGQDTYVIVVASVKGLNVFYRLKIIASLNFKTFYPFGDNHSEEAVDKAEYILYKAEDATRKVTLNENFTSAIPASATQINDVYEVNANAENGYIQKETYITNRLMMFRQVNILAAETSLVKMNFVIKSVVIHSIELGLMTDETRTAISSQNFASRVVIDFNELTGKIEVTLKNVDSYVAVLEIKTTTNAVAYYTFAVERSVVNYVVVVEKETEDQQVSQMPELEQNYAIKIQSPESNSTEDATTDALQKLYLKASLSSSSQNRTDLLRFHIYNGKDLLSIQTNEENKKEINAKFSVSSVFASLVLYTKYGVLRTIPLTLESLIKVVEKDAVISDVNNITQKFADNVLSGVVYDLANVIEFVEIDTVSEPVTVKPVDDVIWNSITIDGDTPNYIVILDDSNSSILILPLNEGVERNVVLKVSVNLYGKEFNFDFNLTINSPIVSNNKNSLNLSPLDGNFYGGGDIEIDIFGANGFYTYQGTPPSFSAEDNIVRGKLNQTYEEYNYTLNILPVRGASAINATRTINSGQLVLKANPVADEIEVVIQATLTMSINGFEFSCVSYLLVVVKPDATVEINYPTLDGTELPFESIYYGDGAIQLKDPARFALNPRVVVTPEDGKTKDVYVNYSISSGDPNLKIMVNGSIANGLGQYSRDDAFSFEFNSTFTYSTVDFEIFVSGISRAIYTVKVYKNVSSVYGIKINNINTMDGANEVFYLGEDRTDIFNGVQAISYTVSASLQSGVSVAVYNGQTATGITFNLSTADRGIKKTIKIPAENLNINYAQLNNLNLSNVQFLIGTRYYTYAEMSHNLFFAMEQDGATAFKIIRRAVVTYLGVEITDADDLSFVEISIPGEGNGQNTFNMNNFNISFIALGGDVTEKDASVTFSIGNNETLGTYSYKVKVNLVIENDEPIEIMAGEKIGKLLSVLGVKKINGAPFVTYSGDAVNVDENIVNSKIKFQIELKTKTDGSPALFIQGTTTPYSYFSSVSPIQYSENRLLHNEKYYNYDFEIIATGAPNLGIYGHIIFKYVYYSAENPIEFSKEITVLINPNWNIILLNSSGGENTENTPEVVSNDRFGEQQPGVTRQYVDILVDDFNPLITKVFAYKENDEQVKNWASQLKYRVLSPNPYVGKAVIETSTQAGVITAFKVRLFEPTFAVRDVRIEIYDDYGYSVVYYYRVEPNELITYSSMTGTETYEGDSFIINYVGLGDNTSSIDHIISLSKAIDSTSYIEVFLKTSTGETIHNAVSPDAFFMPKFNINYIDDSWFAGGARTVGVYFEIHLRQTLNDEAYVIRTATFSLTQRYQISVGNVFVRDGNPTNLINHIDIKDVKSNNTYLGVPQLINEKTLVISNLNLNDESEVEVTVVNAGEFASSAVFPVGQSPVSENGLRYYMLGELSKKDVSLNSFFVTRVKDVGLGLTFKISNGELSIDPIDEESGIENTTYVVHLYNGTKYRDVVMSTGSYNLHEGQFWSILGYEEASSSVAINVDASVPNKITLSNIPQNNVTLQLKNNSAQAPTDIKTITIVQKNATELEITYKNVNGVTRPLEIVNFQVEVENEITTYYIILNSLLLGNDANLIITSKEFEGKPFAFNIRNDKKLVMTIVKKLKSESENVFEVVQVALNGNEKINVALDTNGIKVISLMEYLDKGVNAGFVASEYTLSSTQPIAIEELLNVKDMTYYNDSLELIFGASNRTANISFTLVRERNGILLSYNFGVTLKAYKFSYVVGLSKAFGEMIKTGDRFKLTVTGMQFDDALSSLTVKWPDMTLEQAIASNTANINYTDADFGEYTVVDYIKIVNGVQTFNIESALKYDTEKENRVVIMPRYYIVKFRDALHVLDVTNFKVSPYYHQMSNVYSGLNQRVITDYSQTIEAMDTVYKIEFETWAKDIVFKDANGNTIPTDTLIKAKEAGIMDFRLFVPGGAGNATLDDNFNIITGANIQIGLTYFTIKVYVALNGNSATTEWIELGEIDISLDTHPTLPFKPKDTNDNPIGYTIALDTYNVDEYEETMVRYFEVKNEVANNVQVRFSTNSLFSGENIASYALKRTTVANLTTVNLPTQDIAYYQVSYMQENNLWVNTTIKSEYIDPENHYPQISAINIANGEKVVLELRKDSNIYMAEYTNSSGSAIFGNINFNEFTITAQNGTALSPEVVESIRNDIDTYTITPQSTQDDKVSVAWTCIDLSPIITLTDLHFYGDGTTEGNKKAISGVVALLNVSKVFKLKKLDDVVTAEETTPITSVDVLVRARVGDVSAVEYYAITQVKTAVDNFNTVLESSQTYVYRVENNSELQASITIQLKPFDTADYSNFVIVEKLSNVRSFYGPSVIKLSGTYKYSLGTLSYGEFNEQMAIVMNQHQQGVIKVNLSDYILFDFYDGYYETNIPVIFTSRVAGEFVAVETDEDVSNVINVIHSNENGYTYDYYYVDGEFSIGTPAEETLVIIKQASSYNTGNLMWFELNNDDLPLGIMYYALNGEINVANNAVITGLENGDKVNGVWNGVLKNETAYNDNQYLQVTYDGEVVYFQFGAFKMEGSNDIKIGELFKDEEGNYLPLDYTLFGTVEPYTSGLASYVANGSGVYAFTYDNQLYAILQYPNNSNYNLFDVIYEDNDGKNVFTSLRSSKIESHYQQIENVGWEVPDINRYYAFEYNEQFVVVFVTGTKAFNLFEIFDIDLILTNNEVTHSKLTTEIIQPVTESSGIIHVRLEDANNLSTLDNDSFGIVSDEEGYVIIIDLDYNFFTNLTGTNINYYQTNGFEGEKLEEDYVFPPVQNYPLIEQTDEVNFDNLINTEG